MSYNLNSNSSSESTNKMEINRSGSNNSITQTNSNQEEQIELQTTNTNSNNNMSIDGGTTPSSSSSKLANTSPNTSSSTKTSSSSPMCTNSNKSSCSASSSDENTRKNSSKSNNTDSGATHRRSNNLYSSNEDYDDAEEQEEEEEEENNRYQSSDGSGSGGSGSSQAGGSSARATINTDQDLSTAHSTSAYERLTKSVRSFLNATQILRSHFTSDSPESSAAEESSSLNNQASLSPYSNNSSSEASPPSSSSPSQSGLSPPSLSSSNQSSSCSSSNHHRHHHYHHHHAHSSSNSDKVKNMPKKSNLFDELLKQCGEISFTNNNNANSLNNNINDNNSSNNNLNQNNTNPFSVKANEKPKPSQQKVNKSNLKSLLNILKNYENYSTTMYFPITDNYKLESAKIRIPFRKSVGRNSRRNSTKKSSGIINSNGEDSNELGEVELAFKKQEHQQEQQRASKKSEEIKNENKTNEINRNENNAGSSSASTSISNSNSNTPTSSTGSDTGPTKLKSSEFIVCSLCCHCMYEPITLICGCSFCKSCLNEFNLTSIKLSLIKLAKQNAADSLNELDLFTSSNVEMNGKSLPNSNEISSSHGKTCQSDDENSSVGSSSEDNNHNTNSNNPNSNSRSSNTSNSNSEFRDLSCKSLGLFKCFNCSKVHECNTSEYLKTNTNIASIVDKLFQSKIEIRKLRNDIRRYIVINLENNNTSSNQTRHFDLNKYEKMLTYAYKSDTTNHLLLADLFMLNYFCGRLDKALEYAKKTTEIRPKWSFSYFMKSICYQKIGDLGNLRANLIQCFQLDPSIEQIRYKIFQINYILLKPNHSQITDGKSALAYLKNKDIYSLKKSENPSLDLSAIKRSYSFHNNPDPNQMNDSSKYPRAISIDVQPKKRNSNDSESKSVNSNIDNINYRFKSVESLNADENEQNDSNDDSKQINLNVNLINVNDFECSLCYRLFYNPVTTPCGHSYCSSCLERSLDYQDKCPLCKNSLADVYLAERRHSPTVFLDSLIKNCFSKEYEIRKKQYLDELKELTNNENEIPVFVCTAALPFASCPLHIYEPRYRLMLRRAIETGSKQFGMCMYSEITPYHYTEYGCMLEIRNYQFTRDGRAVVATVGGRRFKVIRAYMKDGYNVAQIEWVTDVREEDPESINELQSLHDKTYQLALKWYRLIPELQKQKILEIYGEIPLPESDIQANDNGPVWHWFLLNILPLENDFQYKFLTKTSLKERLKQIKKLLIFMLLIDRSRQQMTTSTSTQNIYEGDAEISNLTSRSRSSNQIDNDQQDQN